MPAPGYDEEGNELPVVSLAHDEDGNIVIPGSVVIEGNLGITGDVVDDQEDATGVKIVEHSRPQSRENWE